MKVMVNMDGPHGFDSDDCIHAHANVHNIGLEALGEASDRLRNLGGRHALVHEHPDLGQRIAGSE